MPPVQQIAVMESLTAAGVTDYVNKFLSGGTVKEIISTALAICPWPGEGIHFVAMVTYIPK